MRTFLENRLTDPVFVHFHKRMSELADISRPGYTYVGFNYGESGIVSVKLYYVFFGNPEIPRPFSVPELEAVYRNLLPERDEPYLAEPFKPGAGLTFAIKFDTRGGVTRGFFFRVRSNNTALKKNLLNVRPELGLDEHGFENGYGQYVQWKDGQMASSEYLYSTELNKFDFLEEHGILSSRAGCIEIGSAGSVPSEQKFIALGGNELLGDTFRERIPVPVTDLFADMETSFYCPGIYPDQNRYSVYAFGNRLLEDFTYSPVAELVRKFGKKTE